jgi:hypothetical protein
VKLIDIAAINNERFYDAKSSNYATVVQPPGLLRRLVAVLPAAVAAAA